MHSATVNRFSSLVIAFFLFSFPLFSMEHLFPTAVIEGRLNCPVISEHGGTAYMQVSVHMPDVARPAERTPLNLSVVIDRSGSMGDQKKMVYVKKAFTQLVEQLRPEDILSLVVYDDVVDVIRPARRVGNEKNSILRAMDEIQPRGSTNLGGGLAEGLKQAKKNAGRAYISRVVLLSDGLANAGITEPSRLERMARDHREFSVSVTTMGVGLDYNEDLMLGLSESGGGNYYFIEHPNGLAAIVRKEFDNAATVVAQNGMITLTPEEGVSFGAVLECERATTNGPVTIPIGDLCAGETREYTVEVRIPGGHNKRMIAKGSLSYESSLLPAPQPFSVSVRYSHDLAEVEQNRDMKVQARADVARSTVAVEQAMKAMESGDQSAAAGFFHAAQEMVSNSAAASSPAAGAALQDQLKRVESYQTLSKEEKDARKAKKAIQYENYQTRKK